MADISDGPFAINLLGVSDLIESRTNKVRNASDPSPEGIATEKIDVLDLPMTDEELLKLRDEYEKAYAPYEGRIKEVFKRNLRSYLGRLKDNTFPDDETPVAANLQFESEETFIPAATAQDPSPFVFADNTPEGNAVSDDVQTMLQFHAQQLLLRRKLAVMVRQWSIYQLAGIKAGWNDEINDVRIENRKIQDFVFDPSGFVDVYGEFTSWLGERITVTAEKLCELFPKHKAKIEMEVESKMGTDVIYTEWWTDEYCFSTFKKIILDKHKNEFFNYNEDQEFDPVTGLPQQPKRNHFSVPRKPYVFLSVFSLQERPHDVTGLIEQNIPNQAKLSRRVEQIDTNLSQGNNGLLFSENNFNQETAKQASNALTKGVGKVLIPAGGPSAEAVVRLQPATMPEAAFKDMESSENHMRSSWGTQGIASQEQKPDETARGMVLNQGRDTSRIGGGIGDILEQSVAKSIFDWLVQLYCVFYDEKHFGAVLGAGKATEYVTLSAQNIDRQLIVGVTANSMKPKDQISMMNQATELFQMKAIGPKTLLDALDFPNAEEAAGDGVLYNLNPQAYLEMNFPELMQQLQQIQQRQMQEQQAAQQQQMQLEAQGGQQQLQQKAQAGNQQLQQGAQAHAQKIQQNEQSHQQKIQHTHEAASAKLATIKKAIPK